MSSSTWPFFRIALLVTGKGEEQFVPRLFRSLEAEGHCAFQVGRWMPQLRPIKSEKRKQKIVGSGKRIPDRDEEIGLFARRYLSSDFDYVILVDDLEHDHRDQVEGVFRRYRVALDTMLQPVGLDANASVHFLVNMLEAHYFAHVAAINGVLGTELRDYEGDVETIRHPKNDLKKHCPGFDEVEHGRLIVERLDVAHALSNPSTCRSLRTLFGCCSKAIGRPFTDVYQLKDGLFFDVTRGQIERL